jgi:hypothetical protein
LINIIISIGFIMATYTPPNLCIGNFTLQNECTDKADANTMESYAAEILEIAGAQINVFLLRGIHEQGLLMDLTGSGNPISSGSSAGSDIINAFNITPDSWKSSDVGNAITTKPAFIGYDFGTKKTALGQEKYNPSARISQHITTIKIQQSANSNNRVIQARIEKSVGTLSSNISFSGLGNGQLNNFRAGNAPRESSIFVVAVSPTLFNVISSNSGMLGVVSIGQTFSNQDVIFSLHQGTTPFVSGDIFTIKLGLIWVRVDVVNLPNTSNLETISVQPSASAPFWRIVPILFNGGVSDYWEVVKLELIDYKATNLENIQDPLFMENRDRDYSTTSIQLKCQYQPLDSIGDLGKFGFSMMDQYTFTCSFARMIELLGRPIIIGDILEVTPEVQYDAELRPLKKFLEVTDCSWASEGYTPSWRPILYRFMGNQVMPSQETKDIFGTVEQQEYILDDGSFFNNIGQLDPTPLKVTETIKADILDAVPETGADTSSIAEGAPMIPRPNDGSRPAGAGQSDRRDMYIEDGLPPDGITYGEGYVLPDILTVHDGDYFRLNYVSELNVPPRLYRYSVVKHRWIYQETDMRQSYSSHKPSIRNALVSTTKKAIYK